MRLVGDRLTDVEVVLAGIPAGRNHNGGRLAFGPDGYLYVTTGDAGDTDHAQDLGSLGGKILRLSPDGEPAPGNPFGTAVWSYGHRNVQGLGWAQDGRLFASEFGQNELDELNLIEPGASYGWPLVEGWAGNPDHRDPVVTWATEEASPSGIAVTSDGIWVAALRGERLWHVPLTPDGVGAATAHLDLGRLRAVVEAPRGGLWVLTGNTDGRGDPRAGDDRLAHVALG
jgi:glucose/arabinose dehydrogenase